MLINGYLDQSPLEKLLLAANGSICNNSQPNIRWKQSTNRKYLSVPNPKEVGEEKL